MTSKILMEDFPSIANATKTMDDDISAGANYDGEVSGVSSITSEHFDIQNGFYVSPKFGMIENGERYADVYIVTAYRHGERNAHSYVVGAFSDENLAENAITDEEEKQKGKYVCEIVRVNVDRPGHIHAIKALPVKDFEGFYKESGLLDD